MDFVFARSKIETWPIARLRPYARNAKMHGDNQVAKIAASMANFGWTVPCMVADDGELTAGHGRVLAMTMLGLTDVPVIRLSHLDEAEGRAYRIADNQLTELGNWDEAMLRDEIAGLLADDFDLMLPGISDEDPDALLKVTEALRDDGGIHRVSSIPNALLLTLTRRRNVVILAMLMLRKSLEMRSKISTGGERCQKAKRRKKDIYWALMSAPAAPAQVFFRSTEE